MNAPQPPPQQPQPGPEDPQEGWNESWNQATPPPPQHWDWQQAPQSPQAQPAPPPYDPSQMGPQPDVAQWPQTPMQPPAVDPSYAQQPVAPQQWGEPAGGAAVPGYPPAPGYTDPQLAPPWQPGTPGDQYGSYAPAAPVAAGAAVPVIDVTDSAIDAARPDPAAAFAQRTIGDVVLHVQDLQVYYGAAVALKGITFDVRQGEVVVIIGANGAGKTTTMKTISGLSEPLKTVKGDIFFRGENVTKLPAHKVQRLGLAHVPEGRHIFGESTVEDNLLLGSISRQRSASGSEISRDVASMYERFPVLGDRKNRPAGLLSGGEQQMLAICRALMSRPDVLLLDEPSLGLAPIMINAVFDIIKELAAEGTTILLVEQMANKALDIADRAYVLETGAITLEGTGQALLADERVKAAYLGA